MHWCHETTKMGGPPESIGAEAYLHGTSQGSSVRGRTEGRPYPWSALGGFMKHSGY